MLDKRNAKEGTLSYIYLNRPPVRCLLLLSGLTISFVDGLISWFTVVCRGGLGLTQDAFNFCTSLFRRPNASNPFPRLRLRHLPSSSTQLEDLSVT